MEQEAAASSERLTTPLHDDAFPGNIRHLVVIGHPAPTSFNHAIARAYCDAIEACGQVAILRDLYALGFDPLLKADEQAATPGFRLPTEVRAELDLVRSCRAITLVYPIWFGMPPAIITGYVDRVLGAGLTAQSIFSSQPHQLLEGMQLVLLTTSGSTLPWLAERGQWHGLREAFDFYLESIFSFASCEHEHFDAVVTPLQPSYAANCLCRARRRARTTCATLLSEAHQREKRTKLSLFRDRVEAARWGMAQPCPSRTPVPADRCSCGDRNTAPHRESLMKNVLMLVHDDAGQEARLHAATDAVRALGGHLTCLDVTDAPARALQTVGAPLAALLLDQAAANERRNKASVMPRLESKGLTPAWIDVTDDIEQAMIRAGRLADLIVINTLVRATAFPDMVKLARSLVGAVHAPILAVPSTASGFRANGAAVVFWDGSSDAEAALCAALPLLRFACEVTVVQFDTGRPALPAREAAEYLRKHDIVAHTCIRQAVGTPARLLEHHLHRHAPAYAVMGAFGHGRLHDAVFGSVTEHLLATSPVPLVIARHV